MVSARVWLWLATTLVVSDCDSLAVAIRMPVRAALRRAVAWLAAADCVTWAACWVVLRWPVSDCEEEPLELELPLPPLTMMFATPQLEESDSPRNEDEPFTASSKADAKVACVDVSATRSARAPPPG